MKPHIVIDARLYGPTHTGIGRYTQNLLSALSRLSDFNSYNFSLIVNQKDANSVKADQKNRYQIIPTRISHYSLSEQLELPKLIKSLHPDLVHFTHFNKPILYRQPSVITIHDLIKHFFRGQKTTTRNPILYWPKYFAYRLVTELNIFSSNHIIVPSHFWKAYLVDHFHQPKQKITVTHEAVDPNFLTCPSPPILKPDPYLIYTGNLYPHKNIKAVLDALTMVPDIRLKIICARNHFASQLQEQVKFLNLASRVDFLGFLPDKQFKNVYAHALALVHPSFMEGFSLTGLEAMALNCPVISSNSSCLPEVYGDSVLYFHPNLPKELAQQIHRLKNNPKLRQRLIRLGRQQLSKYSWQKTAIQTLDVYSKILTDYSKQ